MPRRSRLEAPVKREAPNGPPRLGTVQDSSLADLAKEAIRTAIMDGTFKPDERISIEQMAGELGVSRTPVREALKALEVDGIVRLLPHRGAVVAPFASGELGQRYVIRAMLEGYAAELACARAAGEIAAVLEANCAETAELMARPGDHAAPLSALNAAFHATIRNGSASPTLIRLLEMLQNPRAFTLWYWAAPDRRAASLAIHTGIAAAFRAAKPAQARRLVQRHLLQARNQLVAMTPGPGGPA